MRRHSLVGCVAALTGRLHSYLSCALHSHRIANFMMGSCWDTFVQLGTAPDSIPKGHWCS